MSHPLRPDQRGLWGFNGVLFLPNSVDGTGSGIGPAWNVVNGAATVSHPVPTTTDLARQLKRTVYTQVAVTANQELGPRLANAADAQFQYGTAVGRGGFYFSAIFTIEAWNNNTGRIFVGLAATGGSVVSAVDAAGIAIDCVGLYHDANDPAFNGKPFNIVNHAGGGVGKAAFATNTATLAANKAFHYEMWSVPGTSTTRHKLTQIDGSATQVAFGTGGGGTLNGFMAPQCQMSNGATDATAGHFGIGVANIYVEPDFTG